MHHVTIDLGKRTSGLALWHRRRLVRSWEVHAPSGDPAVMAGGLLLGGLGHAPDGALWVAEKMRDYTAKGARARDLEGLREVARHLRAELDTVAGRHRLKLVPASAWKAGTPKPVCHARILKHLDRAELDTVRERTKETLDAIGIGLWQTGRLVRGMATLRRRRSRPRSRR